MRGEREVKKGRKGEGEKEEEGRRKRTERVPVLGHALLTINLHNLPALFQYSFLIKRSAAVHLRVHEAWDVLGHLYSKAYSAAQTIEVFKLGYLSLSKLIRTHINNRFTFEHLNYIFINQLSYSHHVQQSQGRFVKSRYSASRN